jgi:hypothetical protein
MKNKPEIRERFGCDSSKIGEVTSKGRLSPAGKKRKRKNWKIEKNKLQKSKDSLTSSVVAHYLLTSCSNGSPANCGGKNRKI